MQTRMQSAIEALLNIMIGLIVSMTANWLILPLVFGRGPSVEENLFLAIAYTVVSFVRSYAVRRSFNRYNRRHVIGSKL